ncbi:MAG: PAS domain-containing sensor histidine kinase [Cryobacterium sp.]|nr:PAS domain-containing sensor histidine kinase [Cryobacterium sp.]
MTRSRVRSWLDFDSPTPFVKQLPTAIFFLLAAVTVVVAPESFVANELAMALGMGFVAIATVLAGYFTWRSMMSGWVLVVPVIDFLAIGFLRVGTGTNNSAFAALIILPIVWLAAEQGRRFIVFSALGAVVTLLLPIGFDWHLLFDPQFMVRGLVTPVVFAVAAAVINELARQWQRRVDVADEEAAERARLLQESVEHAARIAESEAQLRELERMFRGLWGAVTEQSVIGTDRTGLIDAWNPGATKMLGFTDADTEGIRRIDEFHLADELESRSRELNFPPGETVLNPGFSALVEPARLGNADVREWTYVGADGRILPVDIAVTARRNEAGETIGYLFVANDLTKIKEISRLKDEFVGLISHELRTPLSSILGYLELLRDEAETTLTASQLHYLSVAERNANRLLRLVGDLLFTAQVDSGMFHVDQTEQHLDAIVRSAVESARPVASAAGIALTAEIADGALIRGDAVRIGQACDNLISNAIKFTPKGGAVTVWLEVDGDDAVVSVSDTGMGIASAELDKLFSRFFRASSATRNAVPGVGLGLVITKAIVTAHGGELDVSSTEGVGTCFTMRFPLASDEASRMSSV